jgi:hypothetical protein
MFLNTWIDDQMQEDNDQRRRDDIRLLKERVASVKRPILWDELVTSVARHVSTYREHLPTKQVDMRLLSPSGLSFTIRKTSFPCVTLQADFLNQLMIELVFEYRGSDLTPKLTWSERIGFTIDDQDHLQFLHGQDILVDADEAANILLEPILNPKFVPPEAARAVPTGNLKRRYQ